MNRIFIAAFLALLPVSAQAQTSHVPKDLSPLNMFLQADWVVKAVMLGLIVCSLVTWTVFFAKSLELRAMARSLAREAAEVSSFNSFAGARGSLASGGRYLPQFIAAAHDEMALSPRDNLSVAKDRIAVRFNQIEKASQRSAMTGTGILATIGSVSPFVGLFGTVWGIMNSFIGISKAQTTNLAVVAPGIAEALLATAIGLVAAIPAVVIYNHFIRKVQAHRAHLNALGVSVALLATREIDGAASQPVRPAKAA